MPQKNQKQQLITLLVKNWQGICWSAHDFIFSTSKERYIFTVLVVVCPIPSAMIDFSAPLLSIRVAKVFLVTWNPEPFISRSGRTRFNLRSNEIWTYTFIWHTQVSKSSLHFHTQMGEAERFPISHLSYYIG